MTTRDAIAAACDIRPNSLDEKVLAGYLNFLDAEFSEVLQVPLPDNLWPENQELLVPEPVSRVYINWLCAIIDWAQVDMVLYQIDTEQYAVAYEEARAWLRRHYLPKLSSTGAKLEWFPRPPRPQDVRTETETVSGGQGSARDNDEPSSSGGGGKPSVDWGEGTEGEGSGTEVEGTEGEGAGSGTEGGTGGEGTETETTGGSTEQTGGGGKPSVDWGDTETETGGGSSSSSGGTKPSVDWGDEP